MKLKKSNVAHNYNEDKAIENRALHSHYRLAFASGDGRRFFSPSASGQTETPIQRGNMVRNPIFNEELDEWDVKKSKTSGGEAKVTVDKAVFHGSSKTAVRIDFAPGERVFISQEMPGDPRIAKYRFSAWCRYKAQSTGWFVLAQVHGYEGGKAVQDPIQNGCAFMGESMKAGESEWFPITRDFEQPLGVERLVVNLGNHFNAPSPESSGTVWWSEIAITPLIDDKKPEVLDQAPDSGIAIQQAIARGEHGLFLPGQPVMISVVGNNANAEPQELDIDVTVREFMSGSVVERRNVKLVFYSPEAARR